MNKHSISGGTVHEIPKDLRKALISDEIALKAWQDLSPLARNEWICWTLSVKKEETRKGHINRTIIELKDGIRRPCCFIGCIHRTDKPISPSVRGIIENRDRNSKI